MVLRLTRTAVAAAALAAGFVAPAQAASVTAVAKVKVVKPIVLQVLQDLDLGTIVLTPGTWSGAKVSLSRTGILTCPASVTCGGVTQVSQVNVAGSNNETVIISAPPVTMVNERDGTKKITLVPDAPASVLLTSSGPPGVNFAVGGSVTLDASTADGTYVGTIQITADYQ